MRTDSLLDRPTIASSYIALLLEILAERGIARERFVAGMEVRPTLLRDEEARMSGREWGRFILRALELTDDPGLGYEYGLRMRPTVHGLLGFAAMSSATLREAAQVTDRYIRVRQAHFEMHLDDSVSPCRWRLRERVPIPFVALRRFFAENILLGVARGCATILGRELEELRELEIWFDFERPAHFEAFRARLPTVRFGCDANAVVLPSSFLGLRPALADPHASRRAVALCERELALAHSEDDDVVEQVRAALEAAEDGGFPQVEALARSLGTSSRTLKRRLEQSGTSYLAMLESTRRERAMRMLRETDASIREIAGALGYGVPANFTRAFRRWTGKSPTAYRARPRL